MINYREIPSFEDIGIGTCSCDQEQGDEQACSDQNEGKQDKDAETVAYDAEVSPDPEVLLQDQPHLGFLQEDLGEVLDSLYLEVANETVEHAHEEIDRGSVQPRDQLQSAGNCVAYVNVTIVRDRVATSDVPPQLVGCLQKKARKDEEGPEHQRTL